MTLTVGSLFSGIGGFDLGFDSAGFRIAFQVEVDEFCLRVLEKHWPKVPRYRDVMNCRGSIGSLVDSPAKISHPPESALALTEAAQDSGANSSDSSASSDREASSSKTFIMRGGSGCPSCGAPCGTSGIPLCRFACAPVILGPGISVAASSSWPTLTHQSYGSNRGGAAGRSGRIRPSLPTLVKHDACPGRTRSKMERAEGFSVPLLPTLTRCGNDNRKGASPTSGDGLATAVGGRLNPTWCEWYMGFPLGWTDVAWPPESPHSGTPSSRRKSSGSRSRSSAQRKKTSPMSAALPPPVA